MVAAPPFLDPKVRPLAELDSESILKMLQEIPLWVKNRDFDRVLWVSDNGIPVLGRFTEEESCFGLMRELLGPLFSPWATLLDFHCRAFCYLDFVDVHELLDYRKNYS